MVKNELPSSKSNDTTQLSLFDKESVTVLEKLKASFEF
jgi:hypothetical protein